MFWPLLTHFSKTYFPHFPVLSWGVFLNGKLLQEFSIPAASSATSIIRCHRPFLLPSDRSVDLDSDLVWDRD